MALPSFAQPLIHMSFCPDKPILAGFLGSFAPYPFSALAGRHDRRYMPDATASQHPTSCNEDRKWSLKKGWFLRQKQGKGTAPALRSSLGSILDGMPTAAG